MSLVRFPNPENIFRGTLVFTCALELFYLKPQTTFPIYFPNWSQIRELSPNWRPSVSVFLVLHRLKGSRTHTSTSSWVPARRQIFDARKIVRSWLRTRLRSRRFRRRGLNAAAPLLLDKIHRQTFQTIVGRNGSSGELSRCVLVRQTLGKLTGGPGASMPSGWTDERARLPKIRAFRGHFTSDRGEVARIVCPAVSPAVE